METITPYIGLFFLLLVLASPLFVAVEALFGAEGILNRQKQNGLPDPAAQGKQADSEQ